jgi:hypothetical protein
MGFFDDAPFDGPEQRDACSGESQPQVIGIGAAGDFAGKAPVTAQADGNGLACLAHREARRTCQKQADGNRARGVQDETIRH